MKTTNTKTLEQKISGIRFITRSVLAYVLGYGIKLSVLFFYLFEYAVPNDYLRMLPSALVGFALAPILLVISLHNNKNSTKKAIALFDAIVWFFILDVESATSIYQIGKIVFMSIFNGFAAYHLMSIFKNKVVETVRSASELENELQLTRNELQLTNNELEKCNRTLAEFQTQIKTLNNQVTHAKNHFYCRHCSEEFDSPDKVKRHEASCIKNPKNKS